MKRLNKFKKVEQLSNNQFIVHFDNICVFQSYDSIIVYKINGECYLTNKWNYSRITIKYLYLFLKNYCYFNYLNKNKVEKLIKENILKLID